VLQRTRTRLTFACVVVTASASDASARSNSRDPAAYPHPGHDRLAVVQDQQGFSITKAKPEPARAMIVARVPLGARLKLDRALFARNEAGSKEAIDAPRR